MIQPSFRALVSATVLALPLISLNPLMARADQRNFTLVNDSKVTIDKIFVSTIHTNNWGEDILGQDILSSNESVDIQFSSNEAGTCMYDLKVVTADQDPVEEHEVNLCGTVKVIFNGSSLTPQ
jgi:hypothetical protein